MIFLQAGQYTQPKPELDWTDSAPEQEHAASNTPLHLPLPDSVVSQLRRQRAATADLISPSQ